MASSLIFLSFIPFPSSLARRSISVVSSFVHFISYWACCRMVLVLLGFGGRGVVPIFDGSMEESESYSSSENVFLRGLRYWLFLKIYSEYQWNYLWWATIQRIVHLFAIFWGVGPARALCLFPFNKNIQIINKQTYPLKLPPLKIYQP